MNIKNIQKRAGAFGLAAMMSLSMAIPAFAAEVPTKDVTGTYEAGGVPVYSYSYSFGDMKFTYRAASEGTWDPETHQFSGAASGGGWTCATGADVITVTNHSNAAISVQPKFEAQYEGFKGAFFEDGSQTSFNSFTIESAVGSTPDNAPKKSFKFSPVKGSASLKEGDTNVTLGTITLHVAGA